MGDVVGLTRDQIISIHAPREGGDYFMAALLTSLGISIHAPREGGDMFLRRGSRHFLISIHAPREGGDRVISMKICD